MRQWALISTADNAWLSGPLDVEPEPATGQRVETIPIGWPDSWEWSQTRGAFVDLAVVSPLISVGRFISLFTLPEQISIHTKSDTDPTLRALLFMLQGFTEGVSLSDPMLQQFVGLLVESQMVTADRAAAILAGQAPS